MIRVRTKFKTRRSPSTSLLASVRDFKTPIQHPDVGVTRDRQGCHHLPPTPQSWDGVIFACFRAPKHHACVQRNNPCPPGLQPYELTSKNMGKPEGTTNRYPNPNSTSTHTNHMNVEERWWTCQDHNIQTITSSYIMIITWTKLYSCLYALLYDGYESLNME
jgi:hypothetical protein